MRQAIGPLRSGLHGAIRIPADKSISHRALLFASIAEGTSRLRGLLPSHDVAATRGCLEALGVRMVEEDGATIVHGAGIRGFRRPASPLDCVRSGTTMRLLAGLVAGRPFTTILTGHEQLLRRPMLRIVEPLRAMGARIEADKGRAPLVIHGGGLHGSEHHLRTASAQVKSALLLAGLTAEGATTVHEPGPSRDHTERMLSEMGARVERRGSAVTLSPVDRLKPLDLCVPGDPSSAGFWLVAASIVPGSRLTLEGVGINPTRTGLVDVLRAMGGSVAWENVRQQGGEPVADWVVESRELHGTTIEGDTVVRMIDEFPILAVAATQANGTTLVRGAQELRVKESDRIASVVRALRSLGAGIEERPDGFAVEGPSRLRGGSVDAQGDHRLVMALAVAGWVADGPIEIEQAERAEDSYPGFFVEWRRQRRAA